MKQKITELKRIFNRIRRRKKETASTLYVRLRAMLAQEKYTFEQCIVGDKLDLIVSNGDERLGIRYDGGLVIVHQNVNTNKKTQKILIDTPKFDFYISDGTDRCISTRFARYVECLGCQTSIPADGEFSAPAFDIEIEGEAIYTSVWCLGNESGKHFIAYFLFSHEEVIQYKRFVSCPDKDFQPTCVRELVLLGEYLVNEVNGKRAKEKSFAVFYDENWSLE